MEDIKKSLGKEVCDILDEVMMLTPGNDDHSDIFWLYNWLTEQGRTADDFEHILMYTSNEQDSVDSEGGSIIYVARTVAEAMAALSPVLEGRWDVVVFLLGKLFEEYHVSKYMQYGPISNKLSDWVFSIVEDPVKCPEPVMQLEILRYYGTYVGFNRDNREQALTAIMSVLLSSLDRLKEEEYGIDGRSGDFVKYLQLFKRDYLYNFDLKLAEKLKYNRRQRVENMIHDHSHKYSVGSNSISQPRELQTLIVLLKYINNRAHIAYKTVLKELEENNSDEEESFFSDYFNEKQSHVRKLHESFDNLFLLVINFKTALQEPELLDYTVECIMDVVEAFIKVVWAKSDIAKPFCLHSINKMLFELYTAGKADEEDEDGGGDENENKITKDEGENKDKNEEKDKGKDENEEDVEVGVDIEDEDNGGDEDGEGDAEDWVQNEDQNSDNIMEKTRVGQEIIRKYKKRICELRILVTKEILFNELFSNKYLHDILYNNQY